MRKSRRRAMHYTAITLHDGTVLAAFPMRRPSRRILRRDYGSVDPDGVILEHPGAGRELSHPDNESRIRFQDIIAANLNHRRTIRALVLPNLAEIRSEIEALRDQLNRIEKLLPKPSHP